LLACQLAGSGALACFADMKAAGVSGEGSRCGGGRAGAGCLGQCLYVSGVPGTGKTAAALEVVRALRRRAASGAAPAFRFVEINALRLPSPQHAYSALLEARQGVPRASWKFPAFGDQGPLCMHRRSILELAPSCRVCLCLAMT